MISFIWRLSTLSFSDCETIKVQRDDDNCAHRSLAYIGVRSFVHLFSVDIFFSSRCAVVVVLISSFSYRLASRLSPFVCSFFPLAKIIIYYVWHIRILCKISIHRDHDHRIGGRSDNVPTTNSINCGCCEALLAQETHYTSGERLFISFCNQNEVEETSGCNFFCHSHSSHLFICTIAAILIIQSLGILFHLLFYLAHSLSFALLFVFASFIVFAIVDVYLISCISVCLSVRVVDVFVSNFKPHRMTKSITFAILLLIWHIYLSLRWHFHNSRFMSDQSTSKVHDCSTV